VLKNHVMKAYMSVDEAPYIVRLSTTRGWEVTFTTLPWGKH